MYLPLLLYPECIVYVNIAHGRLHVLGLVEHDIVAHGRGLRYSADVVVGELVKLEA